MIIARPHESKCLYASRVFKTRFIITPLIVVNFCKYINNTIQYVNEGLDACYFPVDMPVHYIYQQSIKSIT